jgi:GTPase SAR1 family protein
MEGDQTSIFVLRYKVVLVGDMSVGKTSLISRFVENTFREIYDPSIGVDFSSKTVKFRGRSLKIQMWDTAGQEKYKSLIPSYVRGSSIIFLVYDVTSKQLYYYVINTYKFNINYFKYSLSYYLNKCLGRESFDNISKWISFIQSIERPPFIVLCGNKIDLEEKRDVQLQEGFDLAEKEEMLFFEVSAKENIDVDKMFYTAISCLECFDDIRSDYKNLAYDIQYENNLHDNSFSTNAPPTPKIIVKGENGNDEKINMNNESKNTRKCKC